MPSALRIAPPIQFITELLATVNDPLRLSPAKSSMAKLASAGTVTLPELISTWSLALGICVGFQLFALVQSPEPPVHDIVAACRGRTWGTQRAEASTKAD